MLIMLKFYRILTLGVELSNYSIICQQFLTLSRYNVISFYPRNIVNKYACICSGIMNEG